MAGKYYLGLVLVGCVIVIGMLIYPTIHSMISGISVTGFTDIEKAGMVILSYGMLFWMCYIVYAHVFKK